MTEWLTERPDVAKRLLLPNAEGFASHVLDYNDLVTLYPLDPEGVTRYFILYYDGEFLGWLRDHDFDLTLLEDTRIGRDNLSMYLLSDDIMKAFASGDTEMLDWLYATPSIHPAIFHAFDYFYAEFADHWESRLHDDPILRGWLEEHPGFLERLPE